MVIINMPTQLWLWLSGNLCTWPHDVQFMITYVIIHIHYRVLARTLFGPVECPFPIEFAKLHFPNWVYTNNKIIFFPCLCQSFFDLQYLWLIEPCSFFRNVRFSSSPFMFYYLIYIKREVKSKCALRQPFLAAQKILCFFSCYFNHLNGKEHIRNYKRKCFLRGCFHILRKLTSRVKQEKKLFIFQKFLKVF